MANHPTARDLLRLPSAAAVGVVMTPGWAVFDPAWYLRRHADARDALGARPSDVAVLAYHLDVGQRLGHAPNRYFDEAFFLATYAGAARAVQAGEAESGFDVYCRQGGRHRMPHWLFDEAFYRATNPDLDDAALAAHRLVNGYDHFLRHGMREGRSGSLFLDSAIYRANLPPLARVAADAVGTFRHFLERLEAGETEVASSAYFDPTWYRARYAPELAAPELDGAFLGALHHYLANSTPARFDPLPDFAEQDYLARYPDIAEAVAAGTYRNAYQHFLQDGVLELRAPSRSFDPRYYISAHPSVREALARGTTRDAFAHFLTAGRAAGLAGVEPEAERISPQQGAALARRRAVAWLPALARRGLDFSHDGSPALSAILVLRDRFAETLLTLAALRAAEPGPLGLLLADCGSADETREIERTVRGSIVLRLGPGVPPARAREAALAGVAGGLVLFLEPGVEPAPGALAAARARLETDAAIGAVCGPLVRADGRLASAGAIVWRDGAVSANLRGAAPEVPEANFVRDVDAGATAFLLVRAVALQTTDETGPQAAGGWRDSAGLCLRLREAGWRVVYEPSALAFGAADVPDAPAEAAFRDHHAAVLDRCPEPGMPREAAARVRVPAGRRMLLIEDTVPLRVMGSGFVRTNDIVRGMAAGGWRVTVFPLAACLFGLAAIHADLPDTAEVLHDRALSDLPAFLSARADGYDAIWVVRAHNLDRVKPILDRALAAWTSRPRLVLDSEAIVSLRRAGEAALTGAAEPAPAEIAAEFRHASDCDAVVAVSDAEAAILRGLGLPNVHVLGHTLAPGPTARGFADRWGLLFVGAIHDVDSPNYDGLMWFAENVLPLLEAALDWETRLTVAGYVAEGVSLDRLRDHPRITLRGAVTDLAPLYDAHRVFVAPTRFAAGIPYKLHETAAHGLPIVATELLATQTGWRDGIELLTATPDDPAGFAARILRLYGDPTLWQRLRDGALSRLEGPGDGYADVLDAVLNPAGGSAGPRRLA